MFSFQFWYIYSKFQVPYHSSLQLHKQQKNCETRETKTFFFRSAWEEVFLGTAEWLVALIQTQVVKTRCCKVLREWLNLFFKEVQTAEWRKTNKKLALQSNQKVTPATSSCKQEPRLVMDKYEVTIIKAAKRGDVNYTHNISTARATQGHSC